MKNLVAWPAYLLGGAMMSTGVGEIAGFGLMTFSVGMLLHWRFWLLGALAFMVGFWLAGD